MSKALEMIDELDDEIYDSLQYAAIPFASEWLRSLREIREEVVKELEKK